MNFLFSLKKLGVGLMVTITSKCQVMLMLDGINFCGLKVFAVYKLYLFNEYSDESWWCERIIKMLMYMCEQITSCR